MENDKNHPSDPSETPTATHSLTTLLGISIASVAVVLTLITAFTMYLIYDSRLTEEFEDRIQAQSHEINEQIVNWIQGVENQTRILALDNSVRVTLMLDVDYQLEERLSGYSHKFQNALYFITKNNSSRVYYSDSITSQANQIEQYLALNQGQRGFFRTQDNRVFVGFRTPVIRRSQHLGMAGSISSFQPAHFLTKMDQELGVRLLFGKAPGYVDIASRTWHQVSPLNDGRPRAKHMPLVVIDDQPGYLMELGVSPELHYFVPLTNLDAARNEKIFVALTLSVIAILFGILLAIWLSRSISKPLLSLVSVAQHISQGESDPRFFHRQSSITEVRSISRALIQIVNTLKENEKDISSSLENLKAVLNNMDALVYIRDQNNQEVLFVNQYGNKVLTEVSENSRWLVFRHGGDRVPETLTTQQLMTEVGDGHYLWEATNTETHHWYEFRGQLIPWFGNRTVRMEIATDISLRKINEDKLRLSAAVFDTAAEAVMITDANNLIQKVNPAFCSITGYSEQEMLGKPPTVLASGRHDQHFYDELWSSLEQSGFWQGEIWNRRKTGEVYPEWLSITAVKNEKGVLLHYVSLFSDISKRKRDEEKIRHQANYDFLTGLPNRNLFIDRFSRAIQQSQRDQSRVALLFIDLDQFKYVNDTFGHPAGDQLLQQASQRLTEIMRSSDTVARLGGDEFTVLLTQVDEITRVEDVSGRILVELSKPYLIEKNEAFVSASIGVTVYPDDGTDVDSLLRNADSAMYRAKDSGRNMVHFFTLEMNEQAKRRRTLETALRQAISNNEMELHYQPIIDVASGHCCGAEALLRWNMTGKGIIYPDEFIALAEDTGLIVPMGEWILDTACSMAAAWQGSGSAEPYIAINMSSRQFQRDNVPEVLRRSLQKTSVSPKRITLEITESLLLADDKDTLSVLHELREMGINIAIDDFGTGYSSLSYLKRFPVSVLKVDRSFIRGLPGDQENAALVEAILAMASSLNLKVVAEGVETLEQYQFLKDRQCDMVQGFYFSKAIPEEEILKR
ncbi:MAG: EAL domain-containing protein [Motiliproteus sp.]|nr:EAL domain-containing protein [Motiliproteus sp.]MCW9052840.1 EAL domain-containing protein [Motiliproteus sp.]